MRPRVIVHMMSPLDGRLDVSKWRLPKGVELADQMQVYDLLHDELKADGWMVGSTTMREFAKGAPHVPTGFTTPPRPLHRAKTESKRFAVAIDRKAILHWDAPTANGDHVVVLLSATVPDSHLAELVHDQISYFILEDEKLELEAVLNALSEHFGVQRLLIEGGGSLVGGALDAKVVDEFSLVLFPSIDGTEGGRTIIESGPNGLSSSASLALKSFREVSKGVLWIQYDVTYD